MRWKLARQSSNIEDRRGFSAPRAGGIGCLGIVVVIVIAYLTGSNPLQLLQQVGLDTTQSEPAPSATAPANDAETEFVRAVLGDTEDAWIRIFSSSGRQYQPPILVLYRDAVESACGYNSAAVGPFYCPPDQKVYLDLTFFQELHQRFGAPGDFAQAYVIAHEVGHHVQNLLGLSRQVEQLRRQAGQTEANALSVLVELQADCFAGVWGHHAERNDLLEPGDLEEGLQAAQSVGDDFIQKQSQGYVNPDSFTHGTSEQRSRWFRRGLETGSVDSCNTFESLRR